MEKEKCARPGIEPVISGLHQPEITGSIPRDIGFDSRAGTFFFLPLLFPMAKQINMI